MAHRSSLLAFIIIFLILSAARSQTPLEIHNRSMIVGTWGHVSMDIVYRFNQDGTFRYVISSSSGDQVIECVGSYKINGDHLTLKNTGGRVLKGKETAPPCGNNPETTRLAFSGTDTMTLTYEETGYTDEYARKHD